MPLLQFYYQEAVHSTFVESCAPFFQHRGYVNMHTREIK